MSHTDTAHAGAAALAILQDAGEISRRWFERSGLDVEVKADGSPVTRADRDTEDAIRSALAERFPADGILGEEFGETESRSGSRWIIDPIDGTKSFVHGVPLYANLLAREVDGEIVFGAINLPSLGILVHAERGGGCFRNGRSVRVSARDHLDGAYVMATWLEDWTGARIDRLHASGAVLRTWGDAFGYALVACGDADAVVDFTAQTYDLAPMPVILAEAGGRFTDLRGDGLIDSGHAVASNGRLHDTILELLEY
ncbi:inositol monophosphatase family protein [Tsukamurella soli]|uniref:Histidinol-phosphatase n=1 Tax=Tsukamurella soli TaxID=644556 RepID=A0ABP8J5X7_9ACTN